MSPFFIIRGGVGEMRRFKSFLGIMGAFILFLMLIMPLSSSPAATVDFSLSDSSGDVIQFTMENGYPTDVRQGVTEGTVDLTGVSATISTSADTNSTLALSFSGTPQVDEYHYYWIWFSGTAYMSNNDTHYLGILIYVSITGMSSQDHSAMLTLFHGLYSTQNPDDQYPAYYGLVGTPVIPIVSGSTLTMEFNISAIITNQNFLDLWHSVTSINPNKDSPFQTQYSISSGFLAYAFKTSVPNQQGTSPSGTFWWDFAPDNESTNIMPLLPTTITAPDHGDGHEDSSSEAVGDLEAGTAAPTPGFTLVDVVMLGLVVTPIGIFVNKRIHRPKS